MSKAKELLLIGLLLMTLSCQRFQSDYVKVDLTPRTTFVPLAGTWQDYFTGTVEPAELKRADDMTVTRFNPQAELLTTLDVQYEPVDFDGNHRWDGFDVLVTPVDAAGNALRKPGGLIMELYEFDPETLSSLGKKLLVWRIPEARLLPTWEGERYHFRLAWWQSKPRRESFYVVLVATFVEHDGTVHTRTRAPVSLAQPRYETY